MACLVHLVLLASSFPIGDAGGRLCDNAPEIPHAGTGDGLLVAYVYRRPEELALHWRESPPRVDDVLESAMERLGMPYVFGGIGPDGYDCSGFVAKVFSENGYGLPRVSRDMAKVGLAVPLDMLRPGDLLFFSAIPRGRKINHVAIYLGNGEFIHASSGAGEVTIDNLVSKYYRTRLVAARRIIGLPPGILDPELDPSTDPRSGSRMPRPSDGAVIGCGNCLSRGRTKSTGPVESEHVSQAEEAYRPWYSPLSIQGPRPRFSMPSSHGHTNTVGMDASWVHMREGHFFALTPRFELSMPHLALHMAFGLSLGLRLSGQESGSWIPADYYKDWRYYVGVLDRLEIGGRGSMFHLYMGRSAELDLGEDILVRRLAPSLDGPQIPGWDMAPSPLSLELETRLGFWGLGAKALVDDLFEPRIAGTRIFLQGGLVPDRLGIGLSYIVDLNAPYLNGLFEPSKTHMQAAGVDISFELAGTRSMRLSTRLNSGMLFGPRTSAAGMSLGATIKSRWYGRKVHSLYVDAQARLFQGGFDPVYFDGAYYVQDTVSAFVREPQAAAGMALPKAVVMERRAGGPPAAGLAASFGYSMSGRLELGMYYEDAWFLANTWNEGYGMRSLGASVSARYLRIPGTRTLMDLFVSFQCRHFERFDQLFDFSWPRSFLSFLLDLRLTGTLKLRAGMRVYPGCSNGAAGCSAVVDGVVGVQGNLVF